jgi:hypothetical protein
LTVREEDLPSAHNAGRETNCGNEFEVPLFSRSVTGQDVDSVCSDPEFLPFAHTLHVSLIIYCEADFGNIRYICPLAAGQYRAAFWGFIGGLLDSLLRAIVRHLVRMEFLGI